ncbi:hypothetical protein [Mycolicibacterium obuense]|uniref:Uncharacterized protein n=1 Tax=Mycolicibacterium obuense TaxID=1807 RepID=A0A0M2JNX1_9MYCO|nr:hypothetical protein [Mycolicibacterium obuense]KKE98138.1 hypothetical protein WN67_30865 [Mycolicibacterium obuense]
MTNTLAADATDVAALSTAHTLAMARSDIHSAVNADTDHRRHQYALSARDHAVTVLLERTSEPSQREHAEYYLADAEAIIAATTPIS